MRPMFTAAIALALATPAFAQESLTFEVAESEEHGPYLTTSDGRPIYMFTTDTQAQGEEQDAQISCTSEECLAAWPLVTGGVAPGEGVDGDMIGTVNYEGQQVALYNGWPLYHYAEDEGQDAPQGQDVESFGGEWYLMAPSGEPIED